MRAVVADTGPLNYLVLIGAIEIIPRICETVLIPAAVRDELSHSRAPQLVRDWIAHPPAWLGVHKGKTACRFGAFLSGSGRIPSDQSCVELASIAAPDG